MVFSAVLVACAAPPRSQPAPANVDAARPAPAPVVALPGDPDDAALSDVRLRERACGATQNVIDIEAEVAKMRAEVARAHAEWLRMADDECLQAQGNMWGDSVGASFGAGGLGLSGVGEGGSGQGVGLGSVGTFGGAAAAHSASKTNTQVAGVDEADLVKHDGTYLYLATGRSLRIVQANPAVLVSTTALDGDARQLFVVGNRVVVYVATGGGGSRPCTYAYDCEVAGDGTQTQIQVLDVADRARPQAVRTLELSGSLIAARRIGNAVHTVVADQEVQRRTYEIVPPDVPHCGLDAKQRVALGARWARLAVDNETWMRAVANRFPSLREGGATRSLCTTFDTPLADGRSFTTVVSFDLVADAVKPVTVTMRSRPGMVFASQTGLYLAVRHQRESAFDSLYPFWNSEDEVSDLHAFHIGGEAKDTHYRGSGVVPGHVISQFSMDERDGVLRVATSHGRVPDQRVESSVSTFVSSGRGNLVRIGAAEHIAPGEDIRAVRFDDDRAYVVTFKKTDPLFVLDLAEPRAPRVLGELKIPGFSTYLHRIDPDHLLSIGFDADDHGDFAYFNGLLLQLFDVHDPLRPTLLHKAKLGTRGSSSEATSNHLAFNYLPERNLLAIPATLCGGGGNGRQGDRLTFSGLMVLEASVAKGFHSLGGVDHGKAGATCGGWWSSGASAVQRSVVLDQQVYSIAKDRMKVQNLSHLGTDLATIAL